MRYRKKTSRRTLNRSELERRCSTEGRGGGGKPIRGGKKIGGVWGKAGSPSLLHGRPRVGKEYFGKRDNALRQRTFEGKDGKYRLMYGFPIPTEKQARFGRREPKVKRRNG